MPLKRDIYSHQKNRLLSRSMFRGFAVFTILFLFASQTLQAGASEADDQTALQFVLYDEINPQCAWTDATGKTHLEVCEHYAVFLFAERQHIEQLPAYYRVQKSTGLIQVKPFLQPMTATEHLWRRRLNNRGPPLSENWANFLSKNIFPAQNVISINLEEMQWR